MTSNDAAPKEKTQVIPRGRTRSVLARIGCGWRRLVLTTLTQTGPREGVQGSWRHSLGWFPDGSPCPLIHAILAGATEHHHHRLLCLRRFWFRWICGSTTDPRRAVLAVSVADGPRNREVHHEVRRRKCPSTCWASSCSARAEHLAKSPDGCLPLHENIVCSSRFTRNGQG